MNARPWSELAQALEVTEDTQAELTQMAEERRVELVAEYGQ